MFKHICVASLILTCVATQSLCHFARECNTSAVKRLLADGAPPDSPAGCAEVWTPISMAAVRGCTGVVVALIRGGASLAPSPDDGFTPLMAAARGGDVASVRALLGAGADPDLVNWDGRTALMEAAARNSAGAVTALLDAGASAQVVNSRGETALSLATARCNEQAIWAMGQKVPSSCAHAAA